MYACLRACNRARAYTKLTKSPDIDKLDYLFAIIRPSRFSAYNTYLDFGYIFAI